MKKIKIAITVIFLLMATLATYGSTDLSKSVVKIRVTAREYDYYSPWQLKSHSTFWIQGCVIDIAKGYIVTLSHSLFNSVFVEVAKNGQEKRYPATISLIDYSTGLAIITVGEKNFFKDLAQVSLADKKSKLDKAQVVKWDNQDIFKSYTADMLKTAIQSYEQFGVALFHEMTTGLDSGGDGEPVFQGDKLVGLVAWFSLERKTIKVNSFETIGWMMNEFRKGKYRGQPYFNIDASYLSGDINLKNYYGMAETDTGIIVADIPAPSSGFGALKPGDVITSVDGQKIDDMGYYDSPEYGKLSFLWLIGLKHYADDTIKMTVVRDKKKTDITFPLVPATDASFLIPPQYYDSPPKYYITGGLVLQELSKPFMEVWGADWNKKADRRFIRLVENEWAKPTMDRKRITILSRVLPAAVNAGYHTEDNLVLDKINGIKVKNLSHAKSIIETSKDEFIVFDFLGNDKIVIKRQSLIDSTPAILDRYGIKDADNLPD